MGSCACASNSFAWSRLGLSTAASAHPTVSSRTHARPCPSAWNRPLGNSSHCPERRKLFFWRGTVSLPTEPIFTLGSVLVKNVYFERTTPVNFCCPSSPAKHTASHLKMTKKQTKRGLDSQGLPIRGAGGSRSKVCLGEGVAGTAVESAFCRQHSFRQVSSVYCLQLGEQHLLPNTGQNVHAEVRLTPTHSPQVTVRSQLQRRNRPKRRREPRPRRAPRRRTAPRQGRT